MAGRNTGLRIDFQVFEDLIGKLDELGADITKIVAEQMEFAGEDVQVRTKEALAKPYLPAKGAYSKGKTEETVQLNPQAEISGSMVTIGLGFDKSQPGAGGWLITGTPKMNPDHELELIYARKKYTREITESIMEGLQDEISIALEKFK